MKAIHKVYGEVEVLHRDSNDTTTIVHKGKEHRVMAFVSMLINKDGSKFDISVLPIKEKIYFTGGGGGKRKGSKTADLIEGLTEMRGDRWNSKTRRNEKI